MIKHDSFKSFLVLVAGNIFKLFGNMIISFSIPLALGIINYGMYKSFILYLVYIGIAQLGFSEGVYLSIGGIKYENLDYKKLRLYTRYMFITQFLMSIVLVTISSRFGLLRNVILLLGFNMIAHNMIIFFEYISQSTFRFKDYSIRNFMGTVFNLLALGLILFKKSDSYILYLIITIIGNYIVLIWYCIRYKKIIFGVIEKGINSLKQIYSIYKLGFPLLVSLMISTISLEINKMVVNFFYSIEEFSIYSFSYSLLSLVFIFITSTSLVLFPFFKEQKIDTIIQKYPIINATLIIVLSISTLIYFPLEYIIEHYLVKYNMSIIYFRIALPSIILIALLNTIKFNILKSISHTKPYLLLGLSLLLLTLGVDIYIGVNKGNMIWISITSILMFYLWNFFLDIYLYNKYRIPFLKNFITATLLIVHFYCGTQISNKLLSVLFSIIGLGVLLFLVYKRNFKDIYTMIIGERIK